MVNLLTTGKEVFGWGAAMLLLGSLCMLSAFFDLETFTLFAGIGLLAAGALFVLTGSVMLSMAISPRKTVLFGSGQAAISLIMVATLFTFDENFHNFHGPLSLIPAFLAVCGLIGLTVCLVGLIRLVLGRRTRPPA